LISGKYFSLQWVLGCQLFGLLLLLPIPAYGRITINAWLEEWLGPICLRLLEYAFPNHTFYTGFFTDSPNLLVLLLLGIVFFGVLAMLLQLTQKATPVFAFDVLKVALRYYLAWIFLVYGFAKIFGWQFPLPDAEQLEMARVSHHKGLRFWVAMGQRPMLVQIIGWVEVLVATALFFNATKKLGLLLYAFASFGILIINLLFAIDVKLLSALLLVSALFLLLSKSEGVSKSAATAKHTRFIQKYQNHLKSAKLLIILLLFFSAIGSAMA